MAEDVVRSVDYASGSSDSDVFDMRRQETLTCKVCVWIQPHFASKFSLSGNLAVGISEMLQVIALLSWVFRAIDINMDEIPDPISFEVESVIIKDLPLPMTDPYFYETELSWEKGENLRYSSTVETINADDDIKFLEKELDAMFTVPCCAKLAFIYHKIPNLLSATSLRGLCSKTNLALITGTQDDYKIATFDIVRSVIHSISHLFGAEHDGSFDVDCFDTNIVQYLNPFVMEEEHMINVGPRPNSMRLSPCSKMHISVFLSSNSPSCLTSKVEPYCGNGVTEDKEECDCGSPWQCLMGEQCCGIADGFTPCQIIDTTKKKCFRPQIW